MDRRILIFSILYTIITIFFFINISKDQSNSLTYVYIFPIFWVLGGITLGLLLWLGRVKMKGWNTVGFLFSTPLPTFVLITIVKTMNPSPEYTQEHNKNGHRIKEVKYSGGILKPERKEYWTSVDSVTEKNPYPLSEEYRLDSIIYYDKSGQVSKKEVK
ncbi:hypothetical protein [Rufibacter aurantiacus]|uniref:hypothetical protein n=1 Tax=Rufibacter aurantiacus TaxID=2817374 RepID=UPI001B31892C|nr:hypothetical protein [Rufibacter aurantiacus]